MSLNRSLREWEWEKQDKASRENRIPAQERRFRGKAPVHLSPEKLDQPADRRVWGCPDLETAMAMAATVVMVVAVIVGVGLRNTFPALTPLKSGYEEYLAAWEEMERIGCLQEYYQHSTCKKRRLIYSSTDAYWSDVLPPE